MSTSTRLSERAPERPRLDDPLLDRYLEFVESRARHNTLLATASDLRMFFAAVAKPVVEVTAAKNWNSSPNSGGRAATVGSCVWPTASRGCRLGPSSADCRRCRGCTST